MKLVFTATTCLSVSVAAHGAIIPAGPFVGDQREPLNIAGSSIVADFTIFAGQAHLKSFDGTTTAIHYLFNDSLGGDNVSPRTGSHILGWTQGPGNFTFSPAVTKFGAYWNNNSGANDAAVKFYDNAGNLIDTATASVPAPGTAWAWNGWESTGAAIARIEVTGNGILNGFLWFDDLEKTAVPGPGSGLSVAAATLALRRRHRR